MTNYGLKPPLTLPSLAIQEAKEKRKQVLQGVWERRKIMYKKYQQKLQRASLQEGQPKRVRMSSYT
jgi:hypothetical protein